MSIFLEAIQRFVEPQEVSHPQIVLVVGCLGLASNIVGIFLFHDHGHSHGGGGHSHADENGAVHAAEEGHSHHTHPDDADAADESGNVADVMPESRIANWPKTDKSKSTPTPASEESGSTAVEEAAAKSGSPYRQHKHKKSRSHSRTYSNVEDMPVNPSYIRRSIILDASKLGNIESGESTEDETVPEDAVDDTDDRRSSVKPLLNSANGTGYGTVTHKRKSIDHKAHKHAQPKDSSGGGHGGHGHSHGDLNMRGVFLHVMGDALGNIGVIATALLIWLTSWKGRFYFDPAISLVITFIILCSAIPLCKAASRILLQAVPAGLSVDDIKDDIKDLPGIRDCHHMHVWQLSDTKLVASLHVQVDFDIKEEGSAEYMKLARAIRQCLHEYGIHSSTIQPEFCVNSEHDHAVTNDATDQRPSGSSGDSPTGTKNASKVGSKANSVRDQADACLLDCDDGCGNGSSCCPPADTGHSEDGKGHDHSH